MTREHLGYARAFHRSTAHPFHRVKAAFALTLIAHAAASGQARRVVIDTTRVCSGCRLRFDSVVTLGVSDRGSQRIQDVVAHTDGRFVALTRSRPMPVFSGTGALIDSIGAGVSAFSF